MIRVKSESDRFLKFWGISSLKTLMVKFSSHVTLLRNNNVFSLNRNDQFFLIQSYPISCSFFLKYYNEFVTRSLEVIEGLLWVLEHFGNSEFIIFRFGNFVSKQFDCITMID